MAASRHAAGLIALRICLGVFFVLESLGKLAWLSDPAILTRQLGEWLQHAPSWSRWYLETIAMPGAPVFARLVPFAEIALGLSLIAGVWVRLAAALGVLMVVNFYFAAGRLPQYSFLTSGYALPVLGGLLALAIGGPSRSWSVKG
jgi:uncharacterized membrane protein YphA (DoxX/SURF4 family)